MDGGERKDRRENETKNMMPLPGGNGNLFWAPPFHLSLILGGKHTLESESASSQQLIETPLERASIKGNKSKAKIYLKIT